MFFTKIDELKLYAKGDSNWDLYQDKSGFLFAIAKPGSGAENSHFGHPDHLKRLTRRGISHGYTIIDVDPATIKRH